MADSEKCKSCIYRREFTKELARRTGLSQKVAEITVSAFQEIIVDAWVEKRSICFKGFGIFDIHPTSERMARNPRSMEDKMIPASWKPVFKVSKALKASVNQQIMMKDSQADGETAATVEESSDTNDEVPNQGQNQSSDEQSPVT